jgi:hypothetical protein
MIPGMANGAAATAATAVRRVIFSMTFLSVVGRYPPE